MTYEEKSAIIIEQLRADRNRLLGVFDKIKAEIEDLTYYSWEVSPRTVIDDVLAIIEKYKTESEDKEI